MKLSEELAQKVSQLEERMEELRSDWAEARATLMVNFGPEGRNIPGLIDGTERLTTMVVKILEKLISNQSLIEKESGESE